MWIIIRQFLLNVKKKAVHSKNRLVLYYSKEINFKNSWTIILYTLIYFPVQNWELNCLVLNHLDSTFIHLYFIYYLKYILNIFSWCFFFRKGILEEYSQITSLVTEELVNVHKEIQISVEQLDPSSEYSSFIETHR